MSQPTRSLALLLLVAFTASRAVAQAPNSAWVYPSATGNLLYQLDERGQRIADFSQCGYRGGTEPLPNVTALIPQSRWVYVSPGTGDDTALIQAAIDSVEALTPDTNGWRGVVYLNAGEYQLATTLTINASGVVLKGAGDSSTTGTRLRATDPRQYTLISVTGSGSRSTVANTTRNLIQKLAPAGTRTFEVDSTIGLAVGHTVIVKRPSTANWIADIDMDQLGPAPVVPWTAGSKDLLFDRTITRIDGNWITVDVPLPQTFESKYGGGQIWRYTWTGRIQQVGIEDIYGFSDYASATDEAHAWTFIDMRNLQHGWVRNITAQYFGYAAVGVGDGAKWLTVADSQCLDPISQITGGRRYSFDNTGAECTLFVNNLAREGRHDFVFGSVVAGPNAFVHCTADAANSDTGPHQRWAVGGLFDLVTVNGNQLNVRNRGNSGTGHGWAGAYMAVWNCKATSFSVRNPPTARNWLVGSIGTIASSSGFSVGADPAGTYDSSGPSGTGKAVYPRSLYYGQLQQRMKWPDSEFREVWLGDVDQHSSTGNAGETVNCDATWLSQVEALDALPADAKFDYLVGSRYTTCTLDFPLDPGDTIVAASLTVSLRAIGNAATDNIWLDSTSSPQTFTSLGWTPISTTAPTVRSMEVSPSLLADGRLNLAFGTKTAVDFATLHLQMQKAQPSTQTITLNPVADAYVMGGTNAGTNYGTATTLITKNDTNADFDRETFLRWDLSGISGKIVQAKVRLAGTTIGQVANESCATFVNDDTWGETTINFTNKPAAGKLFAQWLPVAGQPVEFTVTPQVVDTLLGDGKLSLSILSTDIYGSNGIVNYASRENATVADRPQLILTVDSADAAIKAATGSALNLGTAWTPAAVPVNPDTATWNATSLAGTMTLGADLTWAKLIVIDPAGPLTINGTQFLSLGSGGIDMSAATVDLTLNHRVFLGENQPWNVAASRTLAANGQISGPGALTKTGTGNVTLSGANTFTGTTAIDQGTLAFTATNPSLTGGLTFGTSATNSTAGILDLTPVSATIAGAMNVNTNSATASEIKIGTGKTLAINDNVRIGATTPAVTGTVTKLTMTGGGVFNVTTPAAGSVSVGSSTSTTLSQAATLDLRGLSATTINASTTGTLRVGTNTGTNIGGQGQLFLPTPAVADTLATSTLTADTIAVGYNGSNNSASWVNSITLGTGKTTLNADTINVGTGGRDLGRIIYGQTAGDLIIRGATGVSTRATAINVGSLGGATAAFGSPVLMDLSGHDADILVTSLNVGDQARTGTQSYEFNFGAGDGSLASKLDATHVNIGFRGANATTTTSLTSRVNLSGGTVTFGNVGATGTGVDIGSSIYVNAGAAGTVGELNISNGNVTLHNSTSLGASVRLGTNQATGGGTVSASINLTGGTTTLGGDIIRNVTSPRTTSTVRLSGGTLNMGGNDIGTLTEPITLTAESGTLSNVASINGTGGLTKTTAGTLTLSGTNGYAGTTTLSGGTLALGANNAVPATVLSIGSATLNAATFTDTLGTLDVTGSAVINLGAGASLAFANSSAIDWSGGTLNLTGVFISGSSLRFGTASTALTSTQLAKISATGFTGFALNSSGYLIAPSFASWIIGTFANGQVPTNQRGPNDDPDNDGIRNLIEYAVAGQDPTVANSSVGTFTGNTLSFTKRAGTSGLTYAMQKSTDLGITDVWAQVPAGPSYVNNATTISYTLNPGTPAKNFLRLQVLSN